MGYAEPITKQTEKGAARHGTSRKMPASNKTTKVKSDSGKLTHTVNDLNILNKVIVLTN